MSAGLTPACATAPLMAAAPSRAAGTLAKAPWKAPSGVRVAERMTISAIGRFYLTTKNTKFTKRNAGMISCASCPSWFISSKAVDGEQFGGAGVEIAAHAADGVEFFGIDLPVRAEDGLADVRADDGAEHHVAAQRALVDADDAVELALEGHRGRSHARRADLERRRGRDVEFLELALAVRQRRRGQVHHLAQGVGHDVDHELRHLLDVDDAVLLPAGAVVGPAEQQRGRAGAHALEERERREVRLAGGGDGRDPRDGPRRDGVDQPRVGFAGRELFEIENHFFDGIDWIKQERFMLSP